MAKKIKKVKHKQKQKQSQKQVVIVNIKNEKPAKHKRSAYRREKSSQSTYISQPIIPPNVIYQTTQTVPVSIPQTFQKAKEESILEAPTEKEKQQTTTPIFYTRDDYKVFDQGIPKSTVLEPDVIEPDDVVITQFKKPKRVKSKTFTTPYYSETLSSDSENTVDGIGNSQFDNMRGSGSSISSDIESSPFFHIPPPEHTPKENIDDIDTNIPAFSYNQSFNNALTNSFFGDTYVRSSIQQENRNQNQNMPDEENQMVISSTPQRSQEFVPFASHLSKGVGKATIDIRESGLPASSHISELAYANNTEDSNSIFQFQFPNVPDTNYNQSSHMDLGTSELIGWELPDDTNANQIVPMITSTPEKRPTPTYSDTPISQMSMKERYERAVEEYVNEFKQKHYEPKGGRNAPSDTLRKNTYARKYGLNYGTFYQRLNKVQKETGLELSKKRSGK